MASDLSSALQNKASSSTGEVKQRYQELLDILKPGTREVAESGQLGTVKARVDKIEEKLTHCGFKPPQYNEGAGRFFPANASTKSLVSSTPVSERRSDSEHRLSTMDPKELLRSTDIKKVAEDIISKADRQLRNTSKAKPFSLKDWGKSILVAFLDRALEVISEPIHQFVHKQLDRLDELKNEDKKNGAIELGLEAAIREFSEQLKSDLDEQALRGNLKRDIETMGVDNYVRNASEAFEFALIKKIVEDYD